MVPLSRQGIVLLFVAYGMKIINVGSIFCTAVWNLVVTEYHGVSGVMLLL